MASSKNKSKTKLFIIGLVVFAAIVIIGGAIYAVVQIGSQAAETATKNESQTTADDADSDAVTQQSLNRGRNDVNESVKQVKEAHAQADAAVNDASKRVKVTE